ncbi:MAG: hypothetical protein ABJC04_03605 [Verrucomicrobiota bacterium]
MNNTNAALIVPAPSNATTVAALTLRDIKAPVEIPNPWLWVWWTAGILLCGVMAFLLWRWWKKKQAVTKIERIIPPHERARQKLEHALQFINEPVPFTVLVSDAIRVYLEERFSFHAPDRTTEEFLYELQNTSLLLPDQKLALGEFLSGCDLVKFARYEPTETELRELHSAAHRLVTETEPPALDLQPSTFDVKS